MKSTNLIVVGLVATLTLTTNALAASRGGGGSRGGSLGGSFRSYSYSAPKLSSPSSYRAPSLPSLSSSRSFSTPSTYRSPALPSLSSYGGAYRAPALSSPPSPSLFRSTSPVGTQYKAGEYYKTTGLPKVNRSEAAKAEFLRLRGYDKVPNGYQVDHVIPLFKGGSDTPANMQLLPTEAHQAKTAAER